jgi:uncharacterized MAPEG superfamily protein
MEFVAIVTVLALLQYIYFGVLVGQARGKFGVNGPAVTGHPVFERYFRVQMNTLELLVAFLPALWLFAQYISPMWAAILGAIYLVGRFLYLRAYVADPAKRGLGFGLSMLPTLALLLGGLIGAVLALLHR